MSHGINEPQWSDETPFRTCLRPCKCSAADVAGCICDYDDMETRCAIITLRRIRPSKSFSATDIARYVLRYCGNYRVSITNMKLQKLLYLAYGYYYVKTGCLLFDGGFEAWRYGPTNPETHNEYSLYGGFAIPVPSNDSSLPKLYSSGPIIDEVLDKTMHRETLALVSDLRAPWGAWQKTVGDGEGFEHRQMRMEDIEAEFRLRLEQE